MTSFDLKAQMDKIDPAKLEAAKKAFLSVPKSFTIRRGKVTGDDQFDVRLRRAVAAYLNEMPS